ncbi:erythropoietin [Gracilinanus agilis]|uniref:erythropoietin n=1 Tax=Gracilinanus agilis TaxID=191870 RepID=UPI001CFE939A|nr:erythropoietin [Gracilinanus agilis]
MDEVLVKETVGEKLGESSVKKIWREKLVQEENLVKLLVLLQLLLLHLGDPVRGSPQSPFCDSHILERYILEAKEAQNATVACMEDCSLGENITVPDTRVNFHTWKKMEVGQKAEEVWQGLTLLSEAVLKGQALLANSSQTPAALKLFVDKAVSSLRSLRFLLRELGAQEEAVFVPDAPTAAPFRTFTVGTMDKLFRIYSNFLRGKLKLFLREACQSEER